MIIYKILRADEYATLEAQGEIPGAPVDVEDGYVHFSTALQARETAAKHFAGETELKLLAYDPDKMNGELKWEESRGGDLFPHLYGPLVLADAVEVRDLQLGPTGHIFPDGVL